MLESIKKLFKAKEEEQAALEEVVAEVQEQLEEVKKEGKLSAKPDPKEPGKRVYHEYIVPYEAVDGVFPWHARVYGPKGVVLESAGRSHDRREACEQAIAWAERTKSKLRGTKL